MLILEILCALTFYGLFAYGFIKKPTGTYGPLNEMN